MLNDSLVIVLAGGVGERLSPLTKERAKPAVYFGGPYRIIDFTLSNCINAGLRRIFIVTQYKSLSLNRHIRMGWNVVAEELGEFIEILPPQKRVSDNWYLGTADAVYQNLYSVVREAPKQVVILSGDHIYKMDYSKMLRWHIEKGAAATVATYEVPVEEAARRFGVIQVDDEERIVGFEEKPAEPKPIPSMPGVALASMGIYVFEADVLIRALEEDAATDSKHDFGKNILPSLIGNAPVYSYRFSDENKKANKYWRDIGELDAYYEANMDLVQVNPEFNLYDPEWPIRTWMEQAPPAKFVFNDEGRRGQALDSIISSGVIVSGSTVRGSILCPNVRVHSYCDIDRSILMPGVRVGRHARIRNAIIDRDVFIPRGAVIGYNLEEDRKRHTVTAKGIVVVTTDDEPYVESPEGDRAQHEQTADARGRQ
jgi:glucose-1-phosphate adenylyltransferase